jgi:hypothetical protein
MATEGKGPIVVPCYLVNGVPYVLEVDANGKLAMRAVELETLLGGGLPAALDGLSLKVKEQSPLTGFATSANQATLLTELQQKIEPADLNITSSRELAVLLNALVGAVETSLVAFAGGILKTAPGYGTMSVAQRSGALASGATFTNLLNVSGPGILESLDLSTNYNLTDLGFTPDGVDFYLLRKDASGVDYVNPKSLHDIVGESAFWKEGIYDATNNYYHFHLKRPIQYNATCSINYRQQAGVEKNIAIQALYRSIS